MGDGFERVGRGAAVDAGVEILRGAFDVEFTENAATEAGAEGGQIGREHFGVADEGGVGLQGFTVGGDVGFQMIAAILFFAFDQHFDIDGELAIAGDGAADGFHENQRLAFVVAGAAGEDIVAADFGFKGRGFPEFERVRRLDVVVAVEEERGLAGGAGEFGIDQRVAVFRFNESRLGQAGI